MELADLSKLDEARNLHRKMAEDLLSAHSVSSAKQLVRKGIVTLQDFVPEDAAVGLDADEVAEHIKAEHEKERPERERLRREQEEELAASKAADAAAAKDAEDAEALEIWRKFDREHRLQGLPEEPEKGAKGSVELIVSLPGGRRIGRRWSHKDSISAVADFAYGSANDNELLKYPPGLRCAYPKLQLEDFEASLLDVGLVERTVLHASELNSG